MENSTKNRLPALNGRQWSVLLALLLTMVALGIGLGYLLFAKNSQPYVPEIHHEAHPQKQTEEGSTNDEIWTCSMHPKIRQNEPGICPICEMDLVPLNASTSDDPLVLQMTKEAVKLANIQTSTIGLESGKSGKVIRLTGKVHADERNASSQVAHLAGRIEKLLVNFTGEQVFAGQKIAEIYAPDLIAAQQELIEAINLQEFNPSLPESVRQKLRYWKIDEATIQRIESTGKVQETFPIYATQYGVVSKRRVAVGDYIKQGESLIDLIDLSKVWVLFDAYEEDIAEIKIGNQIEFTASTIPNKKFKAQVTFVDPLVNSETRTISIRTEISNENNLLKPGTLVYGELNKVRRLKGKPTVPKTAVMWTGNSSVVYVKLQDREIPSFQFREVEIGEEIGNGYQIIKGLKKGEEVVTYGNFTIDAAAQLNNQASMMNKDVLLKKEEEKGTPNFQNKTADQFKEQLSVLAKSYISVKDAFVETNANKTAQLMANFLVKLEGVDMKLLQGEAHVFWMKQYNAMLTHGSKILALQDIEKQRSQFSFVSDALIISVNAFGTNGVALYVQHCPMAFDNEGGDWLSEEEQINNPYFGDKMLRCGVVKKRLN